MITIKEIAEMANVSRSTVSRALNNNGYVGVEARKRIEKVIKETGYIPSQQAKSLRTKQTKVIGVIVPTIQTETSSKVVAGIDRILAAQDYQILLTNTNLAHNREEEYIQLLRARQVDGIILMATNTNEEIIEQIKALTIPIVIIGQEIEGVPNILYDDYNAARELTSLIIKKGHTKISFIGVNEVDKAVGYSRKKGYLDVMKENNLKVEESWIQTGIFDVASGATAMKSIMESSARIPTATFAVTDRLAIGAMSYLKEAGYQVPTDMALVSIGASEISAYVEPPLTTIDFQYEKAGEAAAQLMLQAFTSENYKKKLVIDYRLIFRSSI